MACRHGINFEGAERRGCVGVWVRGWGLEDAAAAAADDNDNDAGSSCVAMRCVAMLAGGRAATIIRSERKSR